MLVLLPRGRLPPLAGFAGIDIKTAAGITGSSLVEPVGPTR